MGHICSPPYNHLPTSLQWRHNGQDEALNYQPHDCLLNSIFRRKSKKTSKLRITGLCAGNSPVTGEMTSNAENVPIWWRHHAGSMNNWSLFSDITVARCMLDLILLKCNSQHHCPFRRSDKHLSIPSSAIFPQTWCYLRCLAVSIMLFSWLSFISVVAYELLNALVSGDKSMLQSTGSLLVWR